MVEENEFPRWSPPKDDRFSLTIVNSVSLDGLISSDAHQTDQERELLRMTSTEDQELVKTQIQNCDAIITGAESLRAAGAAWDERGLDQKYPLWIILSRKGLEKDLPFLMQTHIPRCVVFPQEPSLAQVQLLTDHGIQVWIYGDKEPGSFILSNLKQRNFCRVLLFGGGHINQIFLGENLVDYLIYTLSPVVLGAVQGSYFCESGLATPRRGSLLASHVSQDHVFLKYSLRNHKK